MDANDMTSWEFDTYEQVRKEVFSSAKVKIVDSNWNGVMPDGYDLVIKDYNVIGGLDSVYINALSLNTKIIELYNQRVQQKYNELIKM